MLAAPVLAAGLLFGLQSAHAHCDSLDGPVAKAAIAALESGNVNLALPYAPATAESEIRDAFAQSLKVRALGPEAKMLADRTFIETTVRLHRAGEGATYTGLKPAGIDYGPAIPAAERAVETGSLVPVKALLVEELEHGLREQLAHVQEAQKEGLKEPKATREVPAARERVSAELEFVTYVEGLHQAIHGAPGHEHKD
ncbi:hypothetical protein HYPDE_23543 [Hyphomicrobium denitrificans 1NES1]|uniref:Uncharacterized protein n=1 Tax=Hyphomicrobium denitrificans 1NES1 TaxID=670307 RepID=N0B8L1_9HYPH|nr:hypothetical protein HYPDE_23543 [Hyphomicrobium denitrificans 1NES1]